MNRSPARFIRKYDQQERAMNMLQGLQFVMVHVADVQQARAFYSEKLGFVVEDEQPDFVQFKAPQGATLAIAKGEVKPTAEGEGIELWWFVDDADATYAELVAKDVQVGSQPIDEPFGRTFSLKDPAGNSLYMLQLRIG